MDYATIVANVTEREMPHTKRQKGVAWHKGGTTGIMAKQRLENYPISRKAGGVVNEYVAWSLDSAWRI